MAKKSSGLLAAGELVVDVLRSCCFRGRRREKAEGAERFGKGRGQGDVAGWASVNPQPGAYTHSHTQTQHNVSVCLHVCVRLEGQGMTEDDANWDQQLSADPWM